MLLNNNGYQVAWLHFASYARGSLSRCRGKELLKPTIPEVASPGDSFLVFFELSQVNSLAGCFLVLQEEEGACISVNARLAYTFHCYSYDLLRPWHHACTTAVSTCAMVRTYLPIYRYIAKFCNHWPRFTSCRLPIGNEFRNTAHIRYVWTSLTI